MITDGTDLAPFYALVGAVFSLQDRAPSYTPRAERGSAIQGFLSASRSSAPLIHPTNMAELC